ncbi:uncharacterized protein MONBRDRAFT_30500 [Monosiga brevicollis MX1]|uniref:Reactive oxygen species modulator 1 n=1 Tax=Monosiga brevicollis TaxID=81824 RepID=A9VE36_MONBE|nr:uncharacterized protein MONBRDRAFT_30500 [Monosiga brevicollis MX1]EDQ84210.1 predicted protein [Monosiga brevicollis MX1]|eukprot:XP_001750998.1 hypothetical protein [Monosiga brevicollis MX1]
MLTCMQNQFGLQAKMNTTSKPSLTSLPASAPILSSPFFTLHSLSLSLSLSFSLSLFLSQLSLTLSLNPSLNLSLILSLTHSLSRSLSLSHFIEKVVAAAAAAGEPGRELAYLAYYQYTCKMTTCFDQVKGGFVVGGALGLAAGGVYGTLTCMSAGYRGRKLLRGTALQMLTFGATFGFFLAVGTGIRCEEATPAQPLPLALQHRRAPVAGSISTVNPFASAVQQ